MNTVKEEVVARLMSEFDSVVDIIPVKTVVSKIINANWINAINNINKKD